MRRREFIRVVGRAAAGISLPWLADARAEQADHLPLIGVVTPLSQDDSEEKTRAALLARILQDLGWTVGRNVRIESRWGAGDPERNRRNVADLVGLKPDVILATGSPTLEPLLQATHTVPIVFVQVSDPVGAGLVESLSHPGGNATGFTTADYDSAGKWLELLKEIAPNVKRAVLLRDRSSAGIGQWGASEAFAGSFGLELRPVNVAIATEVEQTIDVLARDPDGGIIVTNSGPAIVHRDLIVGLAAHYRLPAVYPQRLFATSGGLISYGSDTHDAYRRAAEYIDRILKGAKPNDLPVQNPTKFELVVNVKTAKALGISVPATLLARADEIIE